jgi:hypothetical protein
MHTTVRALVAGGRGGSAMGWHTPAFAAIVVPRLSRFRCHRGTVKIKIITETRSSGHRLLLLFLLPILRVLLRQRIHCHCAPTGLLGRRCLPFSCSRLLDPSKGKSTSKQIDKNKNTHTHTQQQQHQTKSNKIAATAFYLGSDNDNTYIQRENQKKKKDH